MGDWGGESWFRVQLQPVGFELILCRILGCVASSVLTRGMAVDKVKVVDAAWKSVFCDFGAPRPRRLARPRTPPFHGDNTGSNPVGDAI
jgi:hypothetical protein